MDLRVGVFIPVNFELESVECCPHGKKNEMKSVLDSYSLSVTSLLAESMIATMSGFCDAKTTKHTATIVIVEVINMEFAYSRDVFAS